MIVLNGSAVCKDCGNGTLNNARNTQFEFDGERAHCVGCGGSHIDGELYLDSDATEEDSDDDEATPEEIADSYDDPYSDEDFERSVGA